METGPLIHPTSRWDDGWEALEGRPGRSIRESSLKVHALARWPRRRPPADVASQVGFGDGLVLLVPTSQGAEGRGSGPARSAR